MGASRVEQSKVALALATDPMDSTNDASSHAAKDGADEGGRVAVELTEAHKRAAVLMALGMSNTDIARLVGREPHTIGRWKHDEAFQSLVKAAGEAADLKVQADRGQFLAQLSELKLETLPVWRDLLRDKDAAIRLKAAEAIGKL